MTGPLESGFPSDAAKGRPKCGWLKFLDCPHCTICLAQELGLSRVPSMRHFAGIPPTRWTTEFCCGPCEFGGEALGIPTWCPPQAAEHSNSVLRAELQRPMGLQVRPRGQQARSPRTDPGVAPHLVGDGARAPDTRKVGVTPTKEEQSQTRLPRGPVARLHCMFNAVTRKPWVRGSQTGLGAGEKGR